MHHLKSSFFVLFSKNQSRFIHGSFTLCTLYSSSITLCLCPFLTIILSFSLYLYVNLLIYHNPCNINVFYIITTRNNPLFSSKHHLFPPRNHPNSIHALHTYSRFIHAQSRFFTFNHAHHSRSGNRSAAD